MMLQHALPNHGIKQKKQDKPLFVDSHDWAFTPTHGPQFWQATARFPQMRDRL
jgi:hypothetical protein